MSTNQDLIDRATKLAGSHDAAKLAEIIGAGIVPQRTRIGAGPRWVELDGDDVVAYQRKSDGDAVIVNRTTATPAMLEALLVQHAADAAKTGSAHMGVIA